MLLESTNFNINLCFFVLVIYEQILSLNNREENVKYFEKVFKSAINSNSSFNFNPFF